MIQNKCAFMLKYSSCHSEGMHFNTSNVEIISDLSHEAFRFHVDKIIIKKRSELWWSVRRTLMDLNKPLNLGYEDDDN